MTEANRIATHVFAIATVRPALMVVGFAAAIWLARCDGQRSAKGDVRLAARVDTIRIADSAGRARTDTVYLKASESKKAKTESDDAKAASDSLDTMVTIQDDSTVAMFDSALSERTVHLPPLIVENLSALRLTVAEQDTTIQKLTAENLSLYQRDTTRQWQIASRDNLIRELSQRKLCGRKCSFALGFGGALLLVKAVR